METVIKYKGKTTTISDKLFEPIKVIKNKPKKSMRFDNESLYYDGIYYFLQDLKPSTVREGKPFEIQGVFYSGKWMQDTFYIDEELKNILCN